MNAPIKLDIPEKIKQYRELRDRIAEMDNEHKEKMRPYRELLEKMNGLLLEQLNTVEGNSLRTEHGMIYRQEKKSVSLADPDKFMSYVIANDMWDLIDRKANATAVADFIDETGFAPPGVNFSTRFVVGVRK